MKEAKLKELIRRVVRAELSQLVETEKGGFQVAGGVRRRRRRRSQLFATDDCRVTTCFCRRRRSRFGRRARLRRTTCIRCRRRRRCVTAGRRSALSSCSD